MNKFHLTLVAVVTMFIASLTVNALAVELDNSWGNYYNMSEANHKTTKTINKVNKIE